MLLHERDTRVLPVNGPLVKGESDLLLAAETGRCDVRQDVDVPELAGDKVVGMRFTLSGQLKHHTFFLRTFLLPKLFFVESRAFV